MARKSVPEPPGDIPSWIMTFSDVITLLMTFFILLLTFATDEPESFERMQVALFGGGGATGIAGKSHGPLEKDTVLMRERPRSGRLAMEGSEMPPIHSDPAYESLAKGIAGLEEEEQKKDITLSNEMKVPLAMLFSDDGEITDLGRQQLRMLANHLRKQPTEVAFQVNTPEDLSSALVLAQQLVDKSILPGRIGVGQRLQRESADRSVYIMLTRQREQK